MDLNTLLRVAAYREVDDPAFGSEEIEPEAKRQVSDPAARMADAMLGSSSEVSHETYANHAIGDLRQKTSTSY